MFNLNLAIDVHLTTEGRTKQILHVVGVQAETEVYEHNHVKIDWKNASNEVKRDAVIPKMTQEQKDSLISFLDNFDDAGVIYHFKRIL